MPGSRLHLATPVAVPEREFRAVAGLFATGVTVVSTLHGGRGRGMTANAFASVSLDPPLVLVCVRHDSEMRRLLDAHETFTVSVLSADQRGVAAWFADPARPEGRAQFDAVGWHLGPATGAPVISGALAWLECAVSERVVAGDHVVVFGRVLGLGAGQPGEPLLFFAGEYGIVAPPPPVAVRALP